VESLRLFLQNEICAMKIKIGYAAFSDITAAKRLEAQLRQTQAGTGKSRKKGAP